MGLFLFSVFFVYFFFSPQPLERTQMFVTSRLLEMGFSMRHIYWAMEAAGTACGVCVISLDFLLHVLSIFNICPSVCCSHFVVFGIQNSLVSEWEEMHQIIIVIYLKNSILLVVGCSKSTSVLLFFCLKTIYCIPQRLHLSEF